MTKSKNKAMKILVTGGGGFLGSHVADELTNVGHDVTILDIDPSPYIKPNQKMIKADIMDRSALENAMKNIDIVFHFAALADMDIAKDNPQKTMEINIIGTTNILEAARRNNVERFIFASTIYVYSNTGSFYRVSKQACELLVEAYKERYGIDYTILRFGTLYGTRSNESNSVYRFLQHALTKGRIDFSGSGNEIREYIHVTDAARICVSILDDKYKSEILILTGHHRMKVPELLEMIKEIFNNEIDIIKASKESESHYIQTPYSYLPKIGKKIVLNTYCDLGQSLIEILDEMDTQRSSKIINL